MMLLRFSARLTVVAGSLVLWTSGLAAGVLQGGAQDEVTRTTTAEQLEQVLVKYPDKAQTIIPHIEALLIEEIRKNGSGERFVIKEVAVQGMPGRMTLQGQAGGAVLGESEFPTDAIPIMANTPTFPFGDGSVQRFAGTVQLAVPLQADRPAPEAAGGDTKKAAGPPKPEAKSDDCGAILDAYREEQQKTEELFSKFFANARGGGRNAAQLARTKQAEYTITGEGDGLHRLTFGVLDKVGYVYLRGKGKIAAPDGSEVKLGY